MRIYFWYEPTIMNRLPSLRPFWLDSPSRIRRSHDWHILFYVVSGFFFHILIIASIFIIELFLRGDNFNELQIFCATRVSRNWTGTSVIVENVTQFLKYSMPPKNVLHPNFSPLLCHRNKLHFSESHCTDKIFHNLSVKFCNCLLLNTGVDHIKYVYVEFIAAKQIRPKFKYEKGERDAQYDASYPIRDAVGDLTNNRLMERNTDYQNIWNKRRAPIVYQTKVMYIVQLFSRIE